MRKTWRAVLLLGAGIMPAMAQVQENGGTNPSVGENLVIGRVTAVSRDSFTMTSQDGGNTIIVKASERTQILRQTQAQPLKTEPAKLESIRAEETVFARGTLKDGVFAASRILLDADITPLPRKQLQAGGGVIGGVIGASIRPEDMGKTFMMGQVTAILMNRLTVLTPDRRMREVEVNENTLLNRGFQRITVREVKVGDQVSGPGELKDNVFVPKSLLVFSPVQKPDSTLPSTPSK